MSFERFIAIGFIFIILGIIIIFSAVFLSSLRGGQEGQIETGGVIMIGPIPIIFGNSKPLIIISITGAIILMAVYFIISKGEFIR